MLHGCSCCREWCTRRCWWRTRMTLDGRRMALTYLYVESLPLCYRLSSTLLGAISSGTTTVGHCFAVSYPNHTQGYPFSSRTYPFLDCEFGSRIIFRPLYSFIEGRLCCLAHTAPTGIQTTTGDFHYFPDTAYAGSHHPIEPLPRRCERYCI